MHTQLPIGALSRFVVLRTEGKRYTPCPARSPSLWTGFTRSLGGFLLAARDQDGDECDDDNDADDLNHETRSLFDTRRWRRIPRWIGGLAQILSATRGLPSPVT